MILLKLTESHKSITIKITVFPPVIAFGLNILTTHFPTPYYSMASLDSMHDITCLHKAANRAVSHSPVPPGG